MRRLPPLTALRHFEAVARLSSITQAARELNISHSSVSQQIRTLEGYLGQQLFLRKGRTIRPTQAALRYLDEVSACLDRLAIASQDIAARGRQKGISLNATPSFALRWLIPKTSEFQLDNPSIDLKITTSASDDIHQLTEAYDFVFRRDAMEQRDHVCRRLLDDLQTPVLAPELLKEHRIKTPRDLAALPILHMRSRPDAWQSWFQLQGLDDLPAIDGPVFDHFFLSLQAAINGHGVAIGSRVLIEEDLAANKLAIPFPDRNIEGPGFHVLHRRDIADDPTGRRFLRWLEKTAGVQRGTKP